MALLAMGQNGADPMQAKTKEKGTIMNSHDDKATKKHGHASVNGLNMYYEIEGIGDVVVAFRCRNASNFSRSGIRRNSA